MVKTYILDTAAGLETIRDPMIMVVGDTYYLTGTQPPLLAERKCRYASLVFHALCRHDAPDNQRERMYIREAEYRPDGTVVLK